jgi:hypothetical protein
MLRWGFNVDSYPALFATHDPSLCVMYSNHARLLQAVHWNLSLAFVCFV